MWCCEVVLLCLIFSLISSAVVGIEYLGYSTINVNIGGGFILRLSKSVVPAGTCQLTCKAQEVYKWIPGNNKTFTMSSGQLVHPIIYNDLDNYACGIHVFDMVEKSGGMWILQSLDKERVLQSKSAFINIPKLTECPNKPWNDCRLLSLDNYYLGSCDETFRGNFSYKCDFIGDGQMSRQSIPLTGSDGTELLTSQRRTQTGSTVLECSPPFSDHMGSYVDACYIEHVPSNTKYFIKDGLLDTRYFGSFQDYPLKCQFEFIGEITEDETGTWIMSIAIGYNNRRNNIYKNCKFHVKENATLGLEKIASRTNTTIVVETTNTTVKIDCAKNVFYPIKVCYLLTHKGDILFSNDYDLLAIGSCKFEVSPGNWKCGFSGPNKEDKDILQNFKVIRHEKVISGLGHQMSDVDSVTIGCHLFPKNPIKVCMVVSPGGKVFRPTNDQFKSEEFSYYKGGSMKAGYCGITLKKDAQLESGGWKCLIVKMNDEELITQFNLESDVWM